MADIKRIGQYEITGLLGRGAMGEVYKAVDSKMFGRAVAIKLLSDRFTRNEQALTRFKREVEVAARLEHPNIVTIHDRGEHDGRPYFVMEFIDGTDLTTLIADRKSQKPEELLALAAQFCEAIEFAHTEGVIHRDIKPSNIMITQRGGQAIAKLVDFGIVHVERSNLTRSQTQPGTYSYMSPEQMGSDEVDNRSDLFSLGIVLYEMFTGLHPFEAATDLFIAQRIMGDEPEPPKQVESTLPTSLESLILKLLEKDPRQRPQTTAEVSAALRETRRRFMSRGVSDAGDYSNVEDMTRPMVENLVTFGRKKEAEGDLPAAVQAYEKAANLAPDVDRLERKIQKLKHRIESDKKLEEHVEAALEGIRNGDLEAAEEHRKDAWILSPESDRVARLEQEIREARENGSGPAGQAVTAAASAVEEAVSGAQIEMDKGDLDAARHRLVDAIRKYPDDVQARFLLDRVMHVFAWGGDYISYRKRLAEAQEALGGGKFEAARSAWNAAKKIWPEDDEWKSLEREIDARESARTDGLLTRAETLLAQAEGASDEGSGLSLVAQAIEALEQARALGGDEARLSAPLQEARRLEIDLKRRVERDKAEAEARERQLAESITEARARLDAANQLHDETALEAYRACRKLYSDLLQQAPEHPEPEPRIAEIDRAIERVERELGEAGEKAKESERQLESARRILEEARTGGEGSVEQIDRVLHRLAEGKLFVERSSQLDPGGQEARAMLEEIEAAESTLQRQRRLLETKEQGLQNGRALMTTARNLVVEESVDELRRGKTTCREAEQAFRAVVTVDDGHEEAQEALKSLAVLGEHFQFEIQRREAERKDAEQRELQLRNALLEAGALMDRAEAQAAKGDAEGALTSCASIAEMLERVAAIDADHAELRKLQHRRERLQSELEARPPAPEPAPEIEKPNKQPKKKEEEAAKDSAPPDKKVKPKSAKVRRRRELEKANKHLAEARELVEQGQHAQAVPILEDLDAACREREWLSELLPEIEALLEKTDEAPPAPAGRKVMLIVAAAVVTVVLVIVAWVVIQDGDEGGTGDVVATESGDSAGEEPQSATGGEPEPDVGGAPEAAPGGVGDTPAGEEITGAMAETSGGTTGEQAADAPSRSPGGTADEPPGGAAGGGSVTPVGIDPNIKEVGDGLSGLSEFAELDDATSRCKQALKQVELGSESIPFLEQARDNAERVLRTREGKNNGELPGLLVRVEGELARMLLRKRRIEIETELRNARSLAYRVDPPITTAELQTIDEVLVRGREFKNAHPSENLQSISDLIVVIEEKRPDIDPSWLGIKGSACAPGSTDLEAGVTIEAVHWKDPTTVYGSTVTTAQGRFMIPLGRDKAQMHLIVRYQDKTANFDVGVQIWNPRDEIWQTVSLREPLCSGSN